MFVKNLLKSGWIHALFIGVIAYPLGAVSQKIVVSYTNSNILVYTALFMLSSATALLVVSGPGELANSTLRRFETWIYSGLQILTLILGLLIMKFVSATEGVALGLMTGIVTLIISTMFLHQKTNKLEILGAIVILFGFYMIISKSPISLEEKAFLILFVLGRGLSQSSQKIVTEVHKTNRKAVTFKSQLRVAGFVMAVASFVFMTFLLIIATIKINHEIILFKSFPTFSDFVDFKVYLFAVGLGLCIVSISKYCEFYAGKTIGAKYLTSLLSLQIIFVYLLELVLFNLGIIKSLALDFSVISALLFILLGNFIISFSGFFKDISLIKRGKQRDTLENLDSKFMDSQEDFDVVKLNLSNLVALYDENMEQLSSDLSIDKVLLNNILQYDLKDLKLRKKFAKKINHFASKNVSLKDKLTKAHNRYSLTYKFNSLSKQKENFNLYLLDLNKFKPINDSYGHDVGDFVLIEVVNRLNEIPEFCNNVFRIGGDEFVLIQTESLNTNLTDLIIECIEKPITSDDNILRISTSVGYVNSAQCKGLQELLTLADGKMYKHKDER